MECRACWVDKTTGQTRVGVGHIASFASGCHVATLPSSLLKIRERGWGSVRDVTIQQHKDHLNQRLSECICMSVLLRPLSTFSLDLQFGQLFKEVAGLHFQVKGFYIPLGDSSNVNV